MFGRLVLAIVRKRLSFVCDIDKRLPVKQHETLHILPFIHCGLKGLDFSHLLICKGRQILRPSAWFSVHKAPSKSVFSKRKEFAPKGSKFFPFRADSFSEGKQCNFERVVLLESVSVPRKRPRILQWLQFILYKTEINPFMPSGFFYFNSLDRFIFIRRSG